MQPQTRAQLHALSLAFYEAHAKAFDESRVDLPWPGWNRLVEGLSSGPLSVLDIGCGNGRFAAFLREARPQGGRFEIEYIGTDANAPLLQAATERIGTEGCEWRVNDFLACDPVGSDLPEGRFSLVTLMGVLHHVPGRETRQALLEQAARRVAPGGQLALTTWQFGDRARFEKKKVPWSSIGPVDGAPIDLDQLEPGDHLLRFGDQVDSAPRYCHQVSDEEFESWQTSLGLEWIGSFQADGAAGDLNRYGLLGRPAVGERMTG